MAMSYEAMKNSKSLTEYMSMENKSEKENEEDEQ